MEERNNKTIVCSVLFLDIVEYSKKSVTGQISLKDRFNAYLAEAIADVPVAERIILDTGDGAAINFLGDVEAALNAALRLRASLLAEDPYVEPQLLVRIGINLGPVRLVRDINGQPNIVGDGINVAQRIMGFAEPSQILVSRSYYDAVSRLSPQYPGMFHYQGSRTDKHVREHEIYAIGYPGDHTIRHMPTPKDRLQQLQAAIQEGMARGSRLLAGLPGKFRDASPARRIVYAAVVILLLGMLPLMFIKHRAVEPVADIASAPATVSAAASSVAVPEIPSTEAVSSVAAASSVLAASSVAAASSVIAASPVAAPASSVRAAKPRQVKSPAEKAVKRVVRTESRPSAMEYHAKPVESRTTAKVEQEKKLEKKAEDAALPQESSIIVSCKEKAKLFLDDVAKGEVGPSTVTLSVRPGKHLLIISYRSSSVASRVVEVDQGKSVRLQPKECN